MLLFVVVSECGVVVKATALIDPRRNAAHSGRTKVIVRFKTAYIHKNTISRRLKFDTLIRSSHQNSIGCCLPVWSPHEYRCFADLFSQTWPTESPGFEKSAPPVFRWGFLLRRRRHRGLGGHQGGRRHRRRPHASETGLPNGPSSAVAAATPPAVIARTHQPAHGSGFFPARRVQTGNLLYGGRHSRVYSGFVSTVRFVDDASAPDNRVVLKTLPGRTCSAYTLDQFANEAVLLNRVGRHPNIIRMLGMVKHSRLEGLPLIVLEYVDGPNLLDYLRSKLADAGSTVLGSTNSLIHYDLIGRLFRADLFSIAVDVANAMAYLTSLRISHGDLAARNVILAGDFTAKVCDFGLARSYDDSPDEKLSLDRLPIRWSAPELLANPPVWHPKSDVWSFGVLLWEIFSLGLTPYPFCATEEAVVDCVLNGLRLTSPSFVPCQLESLFSHLLSSCWGVVGQPDSRPPFSELLLFLRQLLVLLKSPPAHASDVAGYLSMEPEPSL
ncbi:hypothetical protein AAHC03_025841 [Spirometra sp. Aus1]